MKQTHTIVAVIFLAAVVSAVSCTKGHPSDRQMGEALNKHEADFNRLVTMFKEDSNLDSVWPDRAYSPAPGKVPNTVKVELPKERMQEYQTLFKRLGLSYLGRGHDGQISMQAWNKGSFSASESKSYIFAESPPSPLQSSLDNLGSTWEGFAYKHLRGNWYLRFERGF